MEREASASVVDALLWGEDEDVHDILERHAADRRGLEEFFRDLVAPVLAEVGERWANREITVAEEHRATHRVEDFLAHLRQRRARAPDRVVKPWRAVVACVDGELHTLAARVVADALDARGFRVSYLGPSVPTVDLVAHVRRVRADVVVLSVTTGLHLHELGEAVRALRMPGTRGPVLALGGRALVADPVLASRFDADVVGGDLTAALDAVEKEVASREWDPRPVARYASRGAAAGGHAHAGTG